MARTYVQEGVQFVCTHCKGTWDKEQESEFPNTCELCAEALCENAYEGQIAYAPQKTPLELWHEKHTYL